MNFDNDFYKVLDLILNSSNRRPIEILNFLHDEENEENNDEDHDGIDLYVDMADEFKKEYKLHFHFDEDKKLKDIYLINDFG